MAGPYHMASSPILAGASPDSSNHHYIKDINSEIHPQTTYVRVVKKRNTANKKERRRTQSINNAYADLRDCIPSVPADTKLSKVSILF